MDRRSQVHIKCTPSSYDKDRHGRATMRYSNKHSGDVLMLGVGLGRGRGRGRGRARVGARVRG